MYWSEGCVFSKDMVFIFGISFAMKNHIMHYEIIMKEILLMDEEMALARSTIQVERNT